MQNASEINAIGTEQIHFEAEVEVDEFEAELRVHGSSKKMEPTALEGDRSGLIQNRSRPNGLPGAPGRNSVPTEFGTGRYRDCVQELLDINSVPTDVEPVGTESASRSLDRVPVPTELESVETEPASGPTCGFI